MVLLAPDEPRAVDVTNHDGRSSFVLVCEHAGNRVPKRLANLSLKQADLDRHIGWDIGIADVARALAVVLDAPVVLQNYSRLVCDCNRSPTDADFILEVSDGTLVPGNKGIEGGARQARIREIFEPFHAAVTDLLDRRQQRGQQSRLIAMHSFTPELGGVQRPWHVGVLFSDMSPLASSVLTHLSHDRSLCVGENEPYSLLKLRSETLDLHGSRRGIAAIELEVRQDLLESAADRSKWVQRLSDCLVSVEEFSYGQQQQSHLPAETPR